MPTTDLAGRAYARLTDVKEGDTLEVDGGFTCMAPGSQHVVKKHETLGELYVECADGVRHFLAGQLDDEDGTTLIGMYVVGGAIKWIAVDLSGGWELLPDGTIRMKP